MKTETKQPSFLATCTRKYLQIGFLLSISLVIIAFKLPFYSNSGSEKFTAPEYEKTILEYLPPIHIVKEKKPPLATEVKQKIVSNLKFIETEEELPKVIDKIEEPVEDLSKINIKPETVDEPEIKVTDFAEKMPTFIGGEGAMFKYVAKKVNYCESAKRFEIEGKVHIRFVIDTTGNVTNVEIAKSLHPCLDKQAMDAVKSMPKWIPGEQGLQKVAVRMVLPVNFVLN